MVFRTLSGQNQHVFFQQFLKLMACVFWQSHILFNPRKDRSKFAPVIVVVGFFLETVHSKQANRALHVKRKELLKRKKREE